MKMSKGDQMRHYMVQVDIKRRKVASEKRTAPVNALFRCSCGGYVVRGLSSSSMIGYRADSCDTCHRIQ
jgi:hypothetical protein